MSQFGLLILLIFFNFFAAAQTATTSPTSSPAPSQGPTEQQLDAAYSTGQTSGTAIGTATGETHDANRPTENANFNSFLQSSVNSMMNSQAGRASGQMLESSLTLSAQPYSSNCDPDTISGNEACGTGSALAAMAGLMQQSAPTFDLTEQTAWFNACVYSVMGCNVPTIPNPYTPIVSAFPAAPAPLLGQIIDSLRLRGYTVDPRTGLITLPDGRVVNMNTSKNLGEGLPGDSKEKLKQLLGRMQKDIAKRLSKVNFDSYVKLMGLDQVGKNGQPLAAVQAKSTSDDGRYPIRHNRLPEKQKEKIEVTELTKNYGGTPIGIARANIFVMIKKRYGEKASQKVFLISEFLPIRNRER